MKSPELHKDHRRRMRNRFRKNGLSGFEDHEILEMLLYNALPRRNTNDIAHRLLMEFGDISGVISSDEESLCRIDGIGAAAAGQLRLLGELFSEVGAELLENIPLDSDDRAGIYAMLRMGLAPAESASVVFLDGDGIRISEKYLYRGRRKMTDNIAHFVVNEARAAGAFGILLMHNHKNEPANPSPEDIIITKRLREEAEQYGICRVMHVIVSDDGYLHI